MPIELTANLKEIPGKRSILNEFTETWLARFTLWDKRFSFFNKTLQGKKRDGELNKTAFSYINSIYNSTKNNKILRNKFNQRGIRLKTTKHCWEKLKI